jgi:hypothetical protein
MDDFTHMLGVMAWTAVFLIAGTLLVAGVLGWGAP